MDKIFSFIVLVFITVFHANSSLDICGLEDLIPCDPFDKISVKEYLYPKLRRWFKCGQPEYFLEQIDRLTFKQLDIEVHNGVYYLNNVVITGMENTPILEFSYERNYNVGSANYTYEITLQVKADSLYKINENGSKVTCEGPFLARLGNIKSFVIMPSAYLHRCDGSEYALLQSEIIQIKTSPKSYVKFDYGNIWPEDLKMFETELIVKAAELTTKATNNNIRIVYKSVDVNKLFDFSSYHKNRGGRNNYFLSSAFYSF